MNEQAIKRLLKDLDEAPDDAARVEKIRKLVQFADAARGVMEREAKHHAQERHRLYRARTVSGWVAVVLCANYAAAGAVARELPDVLFNVGIALVWAFVAVVDFKTA